MTERRILAQLCYDGPSSITSLAAAFHADPHAEIRPLLENLERRGMIRRVFIYGKAPGGLTRYEATTAGSIEAAGGAQLTLAPRPAIAVQPALF